MIKKTKIYRLFTYFYKDIVCQYTRHKSDSEWNKKNRKFKLWKVKKNIYKAVKITYIYKFTKREICNCETILKNWMFIYQAKMTLS